MKKLIFLCLLLSLSQPVLAQNPIDPAAISQRKESVHNYLLNIYLAQKRKSEAMTEYKTLLSMKPNDPDLNNNLGKFEAASGQFASAALHIKKACDLDPANSSNWGNLASIYLKMKNYPKAIDAYDHAIDASKAGGQDSARYIELRDQTQKYLQHLRGKQSAPIVAPTNKKTQPAKGNSDSNDDDW